MERWKPSIRAKHVHNIINNKISFAVVNEPVVAAAAVVIDN